MRNIEIDTKGKRIFNALVKIRSAVTDGASTMIGCYKDFISISKNKVPND